MKMIINVLKIIWLSIWLIIATVIFFFPITITSFTSSTGNLPFTISRAWAWTILFVTGVRPKVRGKENINQNQSYIIISNHQSHFDILALVTQLGMQFRWIIKKELRSIPLFGYALYVSRNVFIDRSDHERAVQSIRDGVKRLPSGVSLMFFAEGTRSPDGQIHHFKKGGFVTAIETGLPILPVTVNGSRKILPKKSIIFTPGSVELVVDNPIDPSGFNIEDIDSLINHTRNTIMSNFNPEYPGTPSQ